MVTELGSLAKNSKGDRLSLGKTWEDGGACRGGKRKGKRGEDRNIDSQQGRLLLSDDWRP